MPETAPKRVLILGGGYAGLDTALHLEKIFARDDGVEITLVSHTNYLVFTPNPRPRVSNGISWSSRGSRILVSAERSF